MPLSLIKGKVPHGLTFAEASDIAETVLDAAIRYTDGLRFTNADREPCVDTLIAQHVKLRVWSGEGKRSKNHWDQNR